MKQLAKILCLTLTAFFLLACSGSEEAAQEAGQETSQTEKIKVLLLVGGLGDMSFADSANAGLKSVQEKYGDQLETEVVEFGYDYSVVETYFLDAADTHDIIIMPSQFAETVAKYAADYPDKKFWLYGTSFPFEEGDYNNVYAMNYRSNEAAYLAGYLAASKEGAERLGFLGGMDNNVINDFWYGYIQGAQAANPDIQILTNYVGSFDDTVKGKELSLSMYNAGASTIFNVAGPVGFGLAEAAIESKAEEVDMIGVDSDQAALFESQDRKDLAEVVSTSVLTNVGNTIERAIELELAGNLVYGEVDSLGLTEDAVAIAMNDNYEAAYTIEQKESVQSILEDIQSGEIQVQSVYDLENGIADLRKQIAP